MSDYLYVFGGEPDGVDMTIERLNARKLLDNSAVDLSSSGIEWTILNLSQRTRNGLKSRTCALMAPLEETKILITGGLTGLVNL